MQTKGGKNPSMHMATFHGNYITKITANKTQKHFYSGPNLNTK